MTTDILTVVGEEWVTETALDGASLTMGLYYDFTDDVQDSEYDPATAITTEPGNTAYARQTDTFSSVQTSTDVWGIENDTALSFDLSDTASSDKVDALFILANLTSTYTSGTGDYVVATASLVNEHTIGNVNSIDFDPGDIEINFS